MESPNLISEYMNGNKQAKITKEFGGYRVTYFENARMVYSVSSVKSLSKAELLAEEFIYHDNRGSSPELLNE